MREQGIAHIWHLAQGFEACKYHALTRRQKRFAHRFRYQIDNSQRNSDYIRHDVAKEILSAQINKIRQKLLTNKRIDVHLSDKAFNVLQENALKNLTNGGRGIDNIVEKLFINPLSRYLFDNEINGNAKILVDDIKISESYIKVLCIVQ